MFEQFRFSNHIHILGLIFDWKLPGRPRLSNLKSSCTEGMNLVKILADRTWGNKTKHPQHNMYKTLILSLIYYDLAYKTHLAHSVPYINKSSDLHLALSEQVRLKVYYVTQRSFLYWQRRQNRVLKRVTKVGSFFYHISEKTFHDTLSANEIDNRRTILESFKTYRENINFHKSTLNKTHVSTTPLDMVTRNQYQTS